MDPIIISIIGITLSITFFTINYRRTVGVRKQRIDITNREIVSTILNRIIVSGYKPTLFELETYILGKSIESKVKRSELYTLEQLMAKLYSEVLDNSLLDPILRENKLKEINRLLRKGYSDDEENEEGGGGTDEEKMELISLSELEEGRTSKMRNFFRSGYIGLLSAALGTIISGTIGSLEYAGGNNLDLRYLIIDWSKNEFELYLAIFFASIGLIGSYILFVKFWEARKSDIVRLPLSSSSHLQLEHKFLEVMADLDIKYFIADRKRDIYADYIIKINELDIPVELKAWSIRPNDQIIDDTIAKLRSDINKFRSPYGYIITAERIKITELNFSEDEKSPKVRVVSIGQLKEALASFRG